ncbi:MAG: chorismate lyase [Dechloromonas sp.]|nr:chorismate lyase [Dechloromonas sp.]
MRVALWRSDFVGVPPALVWRDWLLEPASLTRRCQRYCTEFRVRVLTQGRQAGHCDESRPGRQRVREVLLECDGQAVIFAHSVLSTARGGPLGRWFARLGQRSLGSLLFSHPGFQRGAIELTRLDSRQALHGRVERALGQSLPTLWARRSRHAYGQDSVLVTEVFLPTIQQLSDSRAAR